MVKVSTAALFQEIATFSNNEQRMLAGLLLTMLVGGEIFTVLENYLQQPITGAMQS